MLSQIARRARFLDVCDAVIARGERKANKLVAEQFVSHVADRVDRFKVPLGRCFAWQRLPFSNTAP